MTTQDANKTPVPSLHTSSLLPEDSKARKTFPVYSGVLNYFPDAVVIVAHVSWMGNEQHHPGTPLHWDKSKSQDESDALLRHLLEGRYDQAAWRALALLQRKLDAGWRPPWWSDTREPSWLAGMLAEQRAALTQNATSSAGQPAPCPGTTSVPSRPDCATSRPA